MRLQLRQDELGRGPRAPSYDFIESILLFLTYASRRTTCQCRLVSSRPLDPSSVGHLPNALSVSPNRVKTVSKSVL